MGKKWGKILRRELLPQFLTDSHGIWHRCLPWGVDMQDIFFDSGRKWVAMVTAYYGTYFALGCRKTYSGRKWVAMVTAYYGQKIGGNLASRTTFSVFDLFSWNSAQMFAVGSVA